jgi:WD40 repeat protein
MGRVSLVRDERLNRDVAMKTLVPGASAGLAERLRREALMTAGLEHPGIVAIYDASPDGEAPWYTMRVVRGRALSVLLREAREPRERMRLVRHLLAAAQAVGYAHRHGVIHRDLKPDNLMIGELGETQVVDWGLARRLEQGPEEAGGGPGNAGLTMDGAAIGTPQYMSPEQARGEVADPRSDVWSLGLILYEIASGRSGRPSSSAEEALAHARRAEPLRLDDLAKELKAIVSRATAARPEERYVDAAAFADDLASWLDGRRVAAHSYSSRELILRLLKAWRVPLAIGAVALVALAVAIAFGYVSTLRERDRATDAERRARLSEEEARAALRRAETELGRSLARRAADLLDGRHLFEAEATARDALSHADEPLARGVLMAVEAEPRPVEVGRWALPGAPGLPGAVVGDCQSVEVLSDRSALLCLEKDGLSVWRIEAERLVSRWRRPGAVYWAAVLEDGPPLVVHSGASGPVVQEFETGREVPRGELCCGGLRATEHGGRLFGPTGSGLNVVNRIEVGLEPIEAICEGLMVAGVVDDGGRVAAICDDGRVVFGEPGVGDEVGRPEQVGSMGPSERQVMEGAEALAFRYGIGLVPGEARAILGSNDGRLALVDLRRGERVAEIGGGVGVVGSIRVSPDGGVVAVRDGARGVALWDLTSGQWRGRLPMTEDRGHRFVKGHPRRLATWGKERLVVWDLPGGRPSRLRTHGGVAALEVEGKALWVGTGDGLERWDAQGHGSFEPRSAVVKAVVANGDLWVGHGRIDGGLELRSAASREMPEGGADGAMRFETFTRQLAPLGELVARGRDYGPLEVWRADGEHLPLTGDENSRDLEASSDRGGVVWLTGTGDVWVVGSELVARPVMSDTGCSTVATDGLRVACGTGDGVEVFEVSGASGGSGDRLLELHLAAPGVELGELEWSADGRVLAGGAKDGSVWLWVGDEVGPRARIESHTAQVATLVFEGGLLWSGSWDQSVRALSLGPLFAGR